ncbi:MAG: hypothetical protein R3C12_10695 [Planctomycetaceae bacterium]|nr:hypothetical protein [Planctomycetaceae bacterium]
MKTQYETTRHAPAAPPRAGASLVEILMSLMVMSIGLVSVAALFPVTMLRSMQATQLTNAGLLYYQCEDYTRAFPRLVFNDFNTSYGVAGNIVSNVEFTPRSTVFARYGIYNAADSDTVNRERYERSLPLKFVTVIDPLGAVSNPGSNARTYGKDNYGLHTVQNYYYQAVRTNAGFDLFNATAAIRLAQINLAQSMFASNDSWSTSVSSNEVGGGAGNTTLTLADISVNDLQTFADALASNITGRAVVFDRNGKQSHVSLVTGVNAGTQQITLASAVPNNALYAAVPEVRLDLLEARYTCLITVRRQLMNLGPAGTPGADGVDDDLTGSADGLGEVGWPGTDDEVRNLGANLVVFFRRDFSPLAEQVYEAGNLLAGLSSLSGAQQITIRWNGANADSKPRIRNGGWLFDPVNGYWYQISSVVVDERTSQNPVNAINTREAVVLLDRPPEASGGYLMVPERVVEVFDFTGF